MNKAKFLPVVAGLLIIVGVVFRFYRITENDFIFYDEGYYLNWNRMMGEAFSHYHFTAGEIPKAIFAYVSRCLASGKSLWFMLVDLRIFFGGLEQWYLSRLLAAMLGVLTMALTFAFSKKFFKSAHLAWFATALLAVLPSHVFYSHIGMQESLSALLVLAGFYFYLFPSQFGWRTFMAGLCWGIAFFSNYRLIMLPVLMTATEILLALSQGRRLDFRKWLWTVLVFLLCVFVLGNFNHGQNTVIVFSWIFHQTNMAEAQWDWLNVLSYPYYLFRLETVLFALFFFANFYFLAKKDFKPLLPFSLVLVQMGVFTFASEKGARYVGVVLPFMAMAVAYCVMALWAQCKDKRLRQALLVAVVCMTGMMTYKSFLLIKDHSDYRTSMAVLYKADPQAKVLSSQNYVQNLFEKNHGDVREVPPHFENLIYDYKSGYRYLILCPQAYISLTESGERFDPRLLGYLGFITAHFPVQRTYSNFSPALLERFVLEHNENLGRSLKFLAQAQEKNFGAISIYDLKDILAPLLKMVVTPEGKERRDPNIAF